MHVGTDAGRGGDVRIKVEIEIQIIVQVGLFLIDPILIFIQIQRLAQPRQAVAKHQRAIANVHDAAVGHLNILEGLIVRQHHGRHQEGQRQRHFFAVNIARFAVIGAVFNIHHQMAAPAAQLRRGDFLPVQRVANGNARGQLLGAGALIANVLAVGVPDEHAVVVFKGLVAAHVFDILKAAVIRNGVGIIAVEKMLAYGNAARNAVCVRQHIDHFLLVLRLGDGAGNQRREQHSGCHDRA